MLNTKQKHKTQSKKQEPQQNRPFSYYHMKKKNISNSEAVPNGSADFRDFENWQTATPAVYQRDLRGSLS